LSYDAFPANRSDVGQVVIITNPIAKLNQSIAGRAKRLRSILESEGRILETRVPEEIQLVADRLAWEDGEIYEGEALDFKAGPVVQVIRS
jgi:hypothetical protein